VKYGDALALHELRERLLDLLVERLELPLRRVEVLADLDPLDLRLVLAFDALHERDVPLSRTLSSFASSGSSAWST
jgi:hypothetical protein